MNMNSIYISNESIIKSEARYRKIAGDDEALYEELIASDPRPELFWKYSVKGRSAIEWYKHYSRNIRIAELRTVPEGYYRPFDHAAVEDCIREESGRYGDQCVIAYVCVKDDVDDILTIAARHGLDYYRVYDPLHTGQLILEVSSYETPDLTKYVPTLLEAGRMLECDWTEQFGIADFGDKLPFIDEDRALVEQVKNIEIDLFKRLKGFCDDHGLTLFPMYGSMLGTVRDGGIIPGDDDIDVALMREDYDKLMTLADEFEEPYFLQKPDNDKCFFGGYAKFRNRSTTSIHFNNWWVDCCEGIGIDVFPIDRGFRSEASESWKLFKIKHLQRLLYADSYGFFDKFMDMKLLPWKGYKYTAKILGRGRICRMLDKTLASCDDKEGAPIGIYAHYGSKRYLGKAGKTDMVDDESDTGSADNADLRSGSIDMRDTITLLFEDEEVRVPRDWWRILENLYGPGYMTPAEFGIWKHRHGFYDPDVGYGVWKARFHGVDHITGDRKVMLVGTDVIMAAYMKKYRDDSHRPAMLMFVDDPDYDYLCRHERKKRKEYPALKDIEVVTEEYFAQDGVDLSGFLPVICAADVRKTARQLQKLGFTDYAVYWADRSWLLAANTDMIRYGMIGLMP